MKKFKDWKNILIILFSIIIISLTLYIVFSPSSYKKANKVLEQNYKELEKAKKINDDEIKLLKIKQKNSEDTILILYKNMLKIDSLLNVSENKIKELKTQAFYYERSYVKLNKEYKTLLDGTIVKNGDTLINSLQKRFK